MNISESVEALLSSKDRVVERFYERFLSTYPELSHHFENGDLKVQASKVTMALVSVEANFTQRFPATEHYLKVLGHRHYHNGVRPEDFPKFRDVLIEILAEFLGDDWSDQLQDEWQAALNLAIATMLEGYEQTYIF